jgi:hypothetical protein
MNSRISHRSLALLTAVLPFILLCPAVAGEPANTERPYDAEDDLLEVVFVRESTVRLRDGSLVDLTNDALSGVSEVLSELEWHGWHRICDVPEERIDALQVRGQVRTGRPLHNLNNVYRLRIPPGEDVWLIGRRLESLPGIVMARPVPKPMRPPTPDDFEPLQGYLDPASDTPTGINAEYSWTLTGGDGAGVTVCDLEYSWNEDHLDLSKLPGSQLIANTSDPFNDEDHGTAVVGVLVSDDDEVGTTGICHAANLRTAGTFFGSPSPEWNLPCAMAVAIDSLDAGDVIVLEHQWDYTGSGAYIPIEWWQCYYPDDQLHNAVYIAIENAVANGIHVVEAGGNGNINTDGLNWFGDSGAIIVGAGGADVGVDQDLQRLPFSSYGNRFNLQGWGELVVTTGYGTLYDDDGINYAYADTFNGTSSATPVVAGAAACCSGYWKEGLGRDPYALTPALLRNILIMSGTPQNTSVTGNIGPRPNIRAADSLLVQQEIEWADASHDPVWNYGRRGSGCAWGDYDNDGDIDLFVANSGQANRLYRNDDGFFSDVTAPPLTDLGAACGCAWGDYDNDGYLDIYVVNNDGANKLFRNDGAGGFTDATSGPLGDTGSGDGCAWGDYDNDGDIDLYVVNNGQANKLLRNNDGITFTDVSSAPMNDAGAGSCCAWGDCDKDGDLDLYLANYYGGANRLFRNDGGTFVDVTSSPLGNTDEGMGVAWGDYDNDGDLDLYLVNNGQDNKLFRNDGGGSFTDVTSGPLVGRGYDFGCTWGDYDNDGDLDLYISTSYCCNQLLRNDGGGTFTDDTTGPLGDTSGYSIGTAFGDYDGDGDLDLYVADVGTYDYCKLFRNLLGYEENWVHVNLVGTTSNRSGIGARIRIVTGRGSQIREVSGGSGMRSQDSMTAEFGLGDETTADSLVVSWPSGSVDVMTDVACNQTVLVTEGSTSVDEQSISRLALAANVPNPFTSETSISYALPEQDVVSLKVYNVSGQVVRVLVDDEIRAAGRHTIDWDGRDDSGAGVASGVYFARLEAGATVERRRMVVLR